MKMKLAGILFVKKGFTTNIMKVYIFLFYTAVFSFNSTDLLSQNAKIKVDKDQIVSVNEIFDMIKAQTEYSFIYQENTFDDYPLVSLKRGNVNVNQLLSDILHTEGVIFRFIEENTIVLAKSDSRVFQEITLTGRVTDKNGTPLFGISVIVTDRAPESLNASRDFFIRGTSTDLDGNFSVEGEVGHYLAVSGIGYEFYTQLIEQGQTEISVVLQDRAAQLDEVVLVGYGTQRREEVSSAISSIKNEAIVQNVIGNASFDQSLAGLIKGVQIKQTSGRPGASVDINIRGLTSPFGDSDNNPLFVIDGVPFQVTPNITFRDETRFASFPNPLLGINPDDIESIDVLKDAAATAIYGSRGANGVIIVKTKRGKRNQKMKMSFSTATTFSKPIGVYDWLNAQEFRAFSDAYVASSVEAANAGQINPFGLLFGIANITTDFMTGQSTYNGLNPDYFGDTDTDWNDVVYRNAAMTQKYDLSVNGGNQDTNYFLSLSYTDQEGLLLKDELKQYNVRLGFDGRIHKAITIGANVNLGYTNNFSGYDNFNANLNQVLNTRPDFAPRNADGNYIYPMARFAGFFDQEAANPLAFTTENSATTKTYSGIGNVYAQLEVLKNLKIKGRLNGSWYATDSYNYKPSFATTFGRIPAFTPPFSSDRSSADLSNVVASSIITDLTTEYSHTLGNHSLSGLVGFSWQRDISDREYFFLMGFPDNEVLTTATNALEVPTKSASITEVGLNSILGRLAYSYKDKYFVTINVRRDKSSRFAPDNRDAFFPSAAISWNIAKEDVLKSSDWVNVLRLRASAGEVGSVNIGDFRYLQFFERGFRDDDSYNGQSAIGLNNSLVNEDIRWEETREFNLGLDYNLLNNRLRGSIDVYDRKTTDALMPSIFPLESGAREFTSNFADIGNKGFEVEIAGDMVKSQDFTWSAAFNIAKNEAKLEKFNADGLNAFLVDRYELGREPNVVRGYVVDGIFQDAAEVAALNAASPTGVYQEFGTGAGDYRFRDLNGDGVVDLDDREIIGSTQPDFFGGFSTSFQYKGLELSGFFNFSKGTEGSISSGFFGPDPDFGVNTIRQFSHPYRWSPSNTDAPLPRLVAGDPNDNDRISTATLEDTSFLRLRNVQLKYSLPTAVIENLGLTNLSMFVSGSNLWTLTDFSGIDPEIGGLANPSGAFNSGAYPNAKSWSFGINVNF